MVWNIWNFQPFQNVNSYFETRSGSGTKEDPFVIDADQFQQLQAPIFIFLQKQKEWRLVLIFVETTAHTEIFVEPDAHS